jgi:MFS superfamily sulfate permease-like transporter
MTLPSPADPAGTAHGAFRSDLLASVVVFLVALPLCMGIAIASGVPPAAGILTGIVGGLIVGTLSGCPLQVSGPAAGLTVVVAEIVRDEGLERLGLIVLLAGLMQLAAGACRLGQWFRAVSPAVTHGMLAGIGILIFASQFHVLVDDRPGANGLENLTSIPSAFWKGVEPSPDTGHDEAARVGLLTIAVLALWRPLAPGRLKALPAPLVAVVAATAAAAALQLPIRHVEMPSDLLSEVRWPTAQSLAQCWQWPVLAAAASVAVIASAETLLCATAVDQLHRGPRANYDRELAAQGFGNVLCGLLGVLPMTGVIVRSATNVGAGARTRLSAILHGAWLLLLVVLAPSVLRLVPTAALAAVLVHTGVKLVDPRAVRSLWGFGRGEVLIYACTAGTVVATDLLTGVLTGLGLAAARLLWRVTYLRVRVRRDEARGQATMDLEGAATFLRLPRLAAALEALPPRTELHVHFEHLRYIDHACLDLLLNWEKQHHALGGRLVIDWDRLHARFRHPRRREPPALNDVPRTAPPVQEAQPGRA